MVLPSLGLILNVLQYMQTLGVLHAEAKRRFIGSSGLAEKRTNGLAFIGIFEEGHTRTDSNSRSQNLAKSYDMKEHLCHDSPRNRP
jgi:hypothetical protein